MTYELLFNYQISILRLLFWCCFWFVNIGSLTRSMKLKNCQFFVSGMYGDEMNSIKEIIYCFLVCLSRTAVLAMAALPAAIVEHPADEILKKALEAEVYKVSHFYANASDKALSDLINKAENILKDNRSIEFYCAKFKKTPAEIEKLLRKIVKKSRTRLKFNTAKDTRLEAQGRDPLEIRRQVNCEKKGISITYPLAQDIQDCSVYIMLDVPECNTSGKAIDWKGTINTINSQMHNAEFIPLAYRHISLSWHKFKQPFTQMIREKIERALKRANENLKVLFPNGLQNIALVDGAYVLGENAVAFGVAKNPDLLKIVQTISEALSRENLTDFEFPGFEEKSPFHITLGQIIPEKKAYDFKEYIQALNAPGGARASQGESFASHSFKISCTLPKNVYLFLSDYNFKS